MSTVTFDTLKFVETLVAAGVPETQAKAMAQAFREATAEELVTREYLDARLEAVKSDIVKWVAGLLIAQAAFITTLKLI